MDHLHVRRALLTAASALTLAASSAAYAQTATTPEQPPVTQPQQASPLPQGTDAAASDAGGAVGDEVVITANKRIENVQDVPKSVQVVGDAALQRQNVTDIADLQKLVPTIAGTGQTLAIRGVGTGASTVAAQSKVGLVLDDVPQPSRSTIANNLIDIERVEVLPGPQGTLAGRNATGGLVNLVTRGPTSSWGGFVNALATSDREYQLAAFVAGPVSDKIQISFSNYYRGFRGLYKNILIDQWASDYTLGNRSKVKVMLTEDLTATTTFIYQKAHRNGVAGNSGGGPTGGVPLIYAAVPANYRFTTDVRTPPAGFAQLEPGVTAGPRNRYYASPRNGTADTQSVGGIERLEFVTPGDVTLTSITSYLDEKSRINSDFCGCNIQTDFTNTRPEFDGFLDVINHSKNFTQELRVNSPSTGAFHYVAGVFYSDLTQIYNYQRFINPVDWRRNFGSKSIAGYAHADYDITERLKAQGGIRLERDNIAYRWTFVPILATSKRTADGVLRTFPVTNQLVETRAKDDASFVNFDAGVQYQVAPDVMTYATFSRAQQGPIYDGEDNTTAIARPLTPLPQEKVNNYEVGIKSQFWDRRITFNVSAFQGNYQNYQVQTIVNDPNPLLPPVLKIAAVGKVRTRGVETSLAARLTSHLRTDLNLAYTEAKILDFPNAPCYSGSTPGNGGCYTVNAGTAAAFNTQGNLSGELLNRAPRWRGSLTVDYSVPLRGDVEAFVTPLLKFTSKQRTDLLRLPTSYLPNTQYVDVNIGVRSPRFTAELFVRNLFKEFAETYAITANGFTPTAGVLSRQLDRINDRYVGGRVRYNF